MQQYETSGHPYSNSEQLQRRLCNGNHTVPLHCPGHWSDTIPVRPPEVIYLVVPRQMSTDVALRIGWLPRVRQPSVVAGVRTTRTLVRHPGTNARYHWNNSIGYRNRSNHYASQQRTGGHLNRSEIFHIAADARDVSLTNRTAGGGA